MLAKDRQKIEIDKKIMKYFRFIAQVKLMKNDSIIIDIGNANAIAYNIDLIKILGSIF